ncbi:hypothetical protein ACFQY7_26255 [Actinomadura luteofluorescens]
MEAVDARVGAGELPAQGVSLCSTTPVTSAAPSAPSPVTSAYRNPW